MSVQEVFLLAIRWLHAVAAVAWVGGNLFYLLVLRPALRADPEAAARVNALVAAEFRVLVDTAVLVLVLTGAILAFDALTSRYATAPYAVTLAVKVALALWLFHLAGAMRRRRPGAPADQGPEAGGPPGGVPLRLRLARTATAANLVALGGVLVFLLADLLRLLFQRAMVSG